MIREKISNSWSFVPTIVSDTMTKINQAADEVREAASSAKSTLATTTGKINMASKIALFMNDIRTLYIDMDLVFNNPEISFIDKLGRFVFYLEHFWMKLGGEFKFKPQEEEQGNQAQSLTGSISGFVGAIFEALGLKDTHFKIFSKYNTLDTFFAKIQHRFSFIFELFRYVMEFICKCFNTPQILEWYDKVTGKNVNNLVKEASILLATPIEELLEPERRKKLDSIVKDAEEVVLLAGLGGWRQYSFLKSKMEQLASLQDLVFKVEQDSFGRITPFCICIAGESQIGKSQLVRELAAQLIPMSIPLEKRIYTRGNTEHYDGYNGQWCIVVDDWAARVDTDWSELLQWVTCETMVLPMASLDSKSTGKKGTTCQAKLVILTTNTAYPPMQASMYNQRAVLKRRHMLIEAVRVSRETKDDFSHLKFMLKHAECDKDMLGAHIGLDMLKEMIKDRFQTHYELETRLLERRKEMVMRPRNQVLKDEAAEDAIRLMKSRPELVAEVGNVYPICSSESINEEEDSGNRAQILEYFGDIPDCAQTIFSGVSSGISKVLGATRVVAKGYGLAAVIGGVAGMYEAFRRNDSIFGPLIGTLQGIAILLSVKSMEQEPDIVAFQIDRAILNTKLSAEDKKWVLKMYYMREELRQAKEDYLKGDRTVNLERMERAMRVLDMLPYWRSLDELQFNSIEKLHEEMENKTGTTESNNMNKDGVRRRKKVVVEAESNNMNKDGVKRKRGKRLAEMSNNRLPKPYSNEVFSPKSLGLLYLQHYISFLKETGYGHLAEPEVILDLTSSWSEALGSCTTAFQVVDYINDKNSRSSAEGNLHKMELPKPEKNKTFSTQEECMLGLSSYLDYLEETGLENLLTEEFILELTNKWQKLVGKKMDLFSIVDMLNGIGRSEASSDVNCDSVAEVMLKNVVKFQKVRAGEIVGNLNAINVRGSLFLVPYHFFLKSDGATDDNFSIKITNGFIYDNNTYGTSGTLTIPFNGRDLYVSSSALDRRDDWCIYNAGRSWAPGKDIFNYFVTNEDLQFITSAPAMLLLKDPMRIYHHTVISPNESTTYRMGDDGGRFSLVRSWQYKANTKYGDCGAPLLVRESRLPRKIVGIHISGIKGTDFAYAAVITQEKLSSIMPNISQACIMPEMDLETSKRHIMYDNFEFIGCVPKRQQVVGSSETTIRESLISDIFEKKKFPAVLDYNDPRYTGEEDILEKQQDKYTGLRVDLEKKLMDEIVEDIVREHSIDKHYPRPILSEKQMLNGYDTLPRIDPHTSAGYPYSTGWFKKENDLPQLSGKETYLVFEENEWKFRSPLMQKFLNYREEEAKKLRRVKSIWTASLKDETLGWNKIENGNTRLFMNPPMDFTLLLRKYTGAFSSFVFKHNIELGCAAGFNPESGEWSRLAYKLLGVSETVGALDYTWFDGSLGAQLIFSALEIINAWYKGTNEDNNVRHTLFHEIVFSYILVRREVYLKMKGNPSGNALTMVMNNLVSKILLRVYWMTLAPVNWRDCTHFSSNVVSFVCGDDNIFALPEELQDFFSGEKIIETASTIGLTATSERKDKTSVYKLLWETTFLKRGFKADGAHIKPTLDLKSIENMMIWISNSKFMTPLECTQVNVECALKYLYFWGPEVYNHYREKLKTVSMERELNLPLVTYDYQDRLFRETGELPNAYAQMSIVDNKEQSGESCKSMVLTYKEGVKRKRGRPCKKGTVGDILAHKSAKTSSGCDAKSNTEEDSINWKPKVRFWLPRYLARPKVRWAMKWEYDSTRVPSSNRTFSLKISTKMDKDIEESAIGALDMGTKTTLETQTTQPPTMISTAHEGDLEGEVTSQKRQGIIYDEQTQITTVHHTKANYEGTAEENDWNMKNFFMVPVRVASGSWTTTDTEAKELKYFNLSDIHRFFSRWKGVITQYSYFRYRIRFRVELNGTPFHAGSLILAWRQSELKMTDRTTMKAVQHVSLNASYNTVGELETTWCFPNEYLSSEQDLQLGRCGLYVFNKLAAGTGASTSLGWTMYAQLLDVKLSLPRPLAGSAQGLVNFQTINVTNSGTGNAPVNTTGDTFDTAMSGLDLASNVKDPEKMIRWGVSNPFMSHGNPPVDRLSAYPSGVTLATENTFNVGWDEMDIDWIKRLPGYLFTTTCSTTQTFGTILASGACAPLRRLTGPGVEYAPTPLQWLTSQFVNWRGDLEMCVEVISSQYHTGKLFFGVNYTKTPVSNFSASGIDPSTYYGKVIEVNGKENCFKITIPYQHWASWVDAAPNTGYFGGTVTTTNTNVMKPYSHLQADMINYFSLGEWFIAVLNPLVVPAGVSSSIDLNIYMRGGENFEVHRPGFNGLRGTNTAQSDVLGNQKNKVDTHTVTQFIERPRSMRDLLKRAVIADRCRLMAMKGTGETIGRGLFYRQFDIDKVLRTTNPWAGIVNSYGGYMGDWRVKIIVDFSNMTDTASDVVYIGFLNRPATGFTNDATGAAIGEQQIGIRAGEDQKEVSETIQSDVFSNGFGNPYLFGQAPALNGWETCHVVTRNSNVIELEIPYYSILKYTSPGVITNPGTRAYGIMYFAQPGLPQVAADTHGATVTTYFYAGDSFRCGMWLGPASVRYDRSAVSNTRYAYWGLAGVTTVATKESNEKNDWDIISQ